MRRSQLWRQQTAVAAILLVAIAIGGFTVLRAAENAPKAKQRRILYNEDGCMCMWNKKGIKGPTVVTGEDMKPKIEEITYPGSQVDTFLVCINAQCTYYPSKVGTMRGTQCMPEERKKWTLTTEEQRFLNMEAMFAQGVDPYALLLAEAKKRGLEAMLTYRMNDAHDCSFLRCKFWVDHPDYRLGNGLNFGQEAVRDYTFRIIEEAVHRYNCDGIELDFQRFPNFFQTGTEAERITAINDLVYRVRKMLDMEGRKRKLRKRLVLSARVPTSYQQCRQIGLDPVVWAKNRWIDFLTVSEFLFVRYDLPVAPWKKMISTIPIYGSIEAMEGQATIETCLTAEQYRRAAKHLWANGADGIYLFNFFEPRCWGAWGDKSHEPPFEVLKELGDPKTLH